MEKFKIDEIVRYADMFGNFGPTGLMKIVEIENITGENRYYGIQFYGGLVAYYERNIYKANTQDLLTWRTRK